MVGFNVSDITRDNLMLTGPLASEGYDWWWHSFTGRNKETGEEKAFFIEFFMINPALGEEEPVFGQLEANKEAGKKPSYLMVKAGAWGEDKAQLHKFYGIKNVTVKKTAPFHIQAGDCFCSEKRTFGSIHLSKKDVKEHPEWMCDKGKMSWDLKIDKKVAFNVGYGASQPLRDLDAFEMFWHAEGMKTYFSGTVTYNGVEYTVNKRTCYGYSDKNWGRDFTSPWVWLASSHLKSRITGRWLNDTCFDIGGGCPKIKGYSLDRKLLGAFWYEGTPYEYNFSKFWSLTETKFDCRETEDEVTWLVSQQTPLSRMETQITCKKSDMILINYEAPNGSKRHNKLWNGGNGKGRVRLYKKVLRSGFKFGWDLVDDMDVFNVGCEYGEY